MSQIWLDVIPCAWFLGIPDSHSFHSLSSYHVIHSCCTLFFECCSYLSLCPLGDSHRCGQLCIYDPKCKYWPGIATCIEPHMCDSKKGHRYVSPHVLESDISQIRSSLDATKKCAVLCNLSPVLTSCVTTISKPSNWHWYSPLSSFIFHQLYITYLCLYAYRCMQSYHMGR